MAFQCENRNPDVLTRLDDTKGVAPHTPKTVPGHQKPNLPIMPAWLKFVLLATGIVGFVVALLLCR
jgi:hypothetical protein